MKKVLYILSVFLLSFAQTFGQTNAYTRADSIHLTNTTKTSVILIDGKLRVLRATAGTGTDSVYSKGSDGYVHLIKVATGAFLNNSTSKQTSANGYVDGFLRGQKLIADSDIYIRTTTKKAWYSAYGVLNMAGDVGIRGETGAHDLMMYNNLYAVGTAFTDFKYANNGAASYLYLGVTGSLSYGAAPSGTAGTSATVTDWLKIDVNGHAFLPGLRDTTAAGDTTLYLKNGELIRGPSGGGVTSFNTRSGAVTLSSSDVTGALGYTPVTNARTINGKSLSSNITLGLASADFANQGTATTVLHGNASGNPSFGAVGLTTDVTGLLPVANGGTGTATPGIIAGTNVTITGTWPNQTVNSTGSGGLATTNFVFNETPSGTINGSNVTFTLANTPTSGKVTLYENGVLLSPTTDYTISGGTITFVTAPNTNPYTDTITANYMK